MKLVLKKDTLTELATDELALVRGGDVPWTSSCPLILQLTERFSELAC